MSISALTLALYHSEATYSNRLVLIAIANFEGEHGAYPSLETIGRLAGGINRRTVQRAIDSLVESGELTEVRREGVTNLYRITIACPDDCDGTSQHRKKKGGGVQTTRRQFVREGVTSDTQGDGVQTAGGAVSRPPESLNNPIKNRKVNLLLPQDWEPSEDLLKMFKTKWPSIDEKYHTEQFKLYWWGNGGMKKDWELTYQSWMNREQKRHDDIAKRKNRKQETDWEALDRWAREQDENEAN
jgi:hypothetical protein